MKKINLNQIISIHWIVLFLLYACTGKDPITKVPQAEDKTAPVARIISPEEGEEVSSEKLLSEITISFEATDDIEIASIELSLNGTNILSLSEFKDYRRVVKNFTYNKLPFGKHKLTLTVKDKLDRTTSVSVNFESKDANFVPAYTPKYDGEVFYAPFEKSYQDLISKATGTKVESPGFNTTDKKLGKSAYKGATDAYVTFPFGESLKTNNFSASFWYKLDATNDRAGILTLSPPRDNNNDIKTSGFRLFREDKDGKQIIKVNIGTGSADTWLDGGDAAVIDPASDKWVLISFSISPTEASLYLNGTQVASITKDFTGIDWTDCDLLSVGSGAPNFIGWNHLSDTSTIDELRLFSKALSEKEVMEMSGGSPSGSKYTPKYDREIFYASFENSYQDLISTSIGEKVGVPSFNTTNKKLGKSAYKGATDAYVTFPFGKSLKTSNFSASFWYKLDATNDRAGILTLSPPRDNNNDIKTSGFRLFREDKDGKQIIKVNIGTGSADTWLDGGDAAVIDPASDKWVLISFSISPTEASLYLNGTRVASITKDFTGIDWAGCDLLSVGSGAPNFIEWNHLSDTSTIDELRFFNKALSQKEIEGML